MTAMNRRPAGLFAWCLALSATAAFAQAPAANNKKEDVIELSPFEVRATDDRGYVASETMTGSRVATLIKDLPYQVNVITSEFLEDFAVFELADNVTKNNALLARLKQKGNIRPFSGGTVIFEELSFAENGNAGYYSGYDLLPVAAQDVLSADRKSVV